MDIIDKIIYMLNEKKLTQRALADHIGIPESKISEWKSGKTKSYIKYIDKIADFFEVSTDYLLGTDKTLNIVTAPINNGSAVVQGVNHSSVFVHNGSKHTLTDEAVELLRVFELLDVKHRHRLLDLAFSLEEEMNNKGL